MPCNAFIHWSNAFIHWIGLLHTDDKRTFDRPLARLLGYWRLHYWNQLALLNRSWHAALVDFWDRCTDAPVVLFMLCKDSSKSPRLLLKPECLKFGSEACYERSIEIANSMLRWRIARIRRRPTPLHSATICYRGGLLSLRHDYPPRGMRVAIFRCSSVPVFRGGRPDVCMRGLSPRRAHSWVQDGDY
jgi:hypothetical protein